MSECRLIRGGDGVPYQTYNPTDTTVRAVIAWTDPNEQESVVLLEESETA